MMEGGSRRMELTKAGEMFSDLVRERVMGAGKRI